MESARRNRNKIQNMPWTSSTSDRARSRLGHCASRRRRTGGQGARRLPICGAPCAARQAVVHRPPKNASRQLGFSHGGHSAGCSDRHPNLLGRFSHGLRAPSHRGASSRGWATRGWRPAERGTGPDWQGDRCRRDHAAISQQLRRGCQLNRLCQVTALRAVVVEWRT